MLESNLIRKGIIKTTVVLVLSLLLFSISACSSNTKSPNIVIIFTDDQGYADVGTYGAKGFTTPNLDKMADEGMRFTNFYVSQAVCSASRAAMLTGCYSERVGIQGALMPWSNIGLNPDEDTIADMLKKQGYATGVFGKWHLGHHEEFLPPNQGFDEYLGLPYSNDMWPVGYDGKPMVEGRKKYYPPLPLIDGKLPVDTIRTLDDQGTLTTRYTERAVKFIEKNKSNPFFLYVPHSMPHVPLGVSDKFKGKSEQGMYGDVIMEIDWSVGEILRSLRENGLEENTIVIFASDNGPWLNFGNHAGSALPLREGKGTMFEGGPRVPCIIRWPENIQAGSICDKMAATIDFLPTIAEITGAPLPKNKIDGVNILQLLKGNEDANPRNEYFYYYGRELRAVRQGEWKLYFPHSSRSYAGTKVGKDGLPGEYATITLKSHELYNLNDDISETKNVAELNPDIVKRLEKLAQSKREELGDKITNTRGKEIREPGRRISENISEVKHLAVGKKISLKNLYHPNYTGGGKAGLTNGTRGTTDHQDGTWQGYEGIDQEVVIDLGEQTKIKKVTCGFLRDQMVWVFLPKEVEISLSRDGEKYEKVKEFKEKLEVAPQALKKEYTAKFEEKEIQFIKVKIKNRAVCPEWHPGAGGRAWFFTDEIIVE
ncbi:MAG: sulfatase-like hydrolase/transferase [Bacteroidota bacterium]